MIVSRRAGARPVECCHASHQVSSRASSRRIRLVWQIHDVEPLLVGWYGSQSPRPLFLCRDLSTQSLNRTRTQALIHTKKKQLVLDDRTTNRSPVLVKHLLRLAVQELIASIESAC